MPFSQCLPRRTHKTNRTYAHGSACTLVAATQVSLLRCIHYRAG